MKDFERNLKALELLDEGNFAGAQALFAKNAKLCPSYQTYNNLGRFFLEFGNERRDGKNANAKKVAFRYLKKSIELNPNIFAYRNLAYFSYELFLYENGRLEDAEKYQAEVLDLKCNDEDIYNYAVILYQAGKYRQGLESLNKMVKFVSGANLLYLLCLLKLNKLSKSTLNDHQETMAKLELFSQQYFYYHCKDYSRVISITEMYPACSLEVDKESLATYIDSLIKIASKTDIKRHMNDICKELSVESMDFLSLLKNEHKRKLLIKQAEIIPSMEGFCGFYGCPLHNTSW